MVPLGSRRRLAPSPCRPLWHLLLPLLGLTVAGPTRSVQALRPRDWASAASSFLGTHRDWRGLLRAASDQPSSLRSPSAVRPAGDSAQAAFSESSPAAGSPSRFSNDQPATTPSLSGRPPCLGDCLGVEGRQARHSGRPGEFDISPSRHQHLGDEVPSALLEPLYGGYFGVTMNNTIRVDDYVQSIGFSPTTFGAFAHFPLQVEDVDNLRKFLKQIASFGGVVLLSLEPWSGLAAVTETACRELVDFLAPYELAGVSFFLRFGHEMNGGWYTWCQKPTLYKEKFRLLATYVQTFLCRTAMLWAPNYGEGYPFSAGGHSCVKGWCVDFELLDTNRDGVLSMEDDMYTPYYPGDDVVDWVGMTMYHWGRRGPWVNNTVPEEQSFYNKVPLSQPTPPWNESKRMNTVPEPNSFWEKLTGNYSGENGNETGLPNFYALFCGNDSVHQKPLAIPEVAAMWRGDAACCSDELEIKRTWWNQVLRLGGDTTDSRDVSKWLPRMKLVSWFDERKTEGGVTIDWTFSLNATIRKKFVEDFDEQNERMGSTYWKLLRQYQMDESLVDASVASRNITIYTNETLTVTLGVPLQGHPAEVGVELYSLDEFGIASRFFGAGSTILRTQGSWSVDVDIIFKEPQDASWQRGMLYYSAYARPLGGNPYNRSDLCSIRSPFVPVQAQRGGSRPPAPLSPSRLLLEEGEDTLIAFLLFLLLFAAYVALRRRMLAGGHISDMVTGAFRYAAAQGNIAVMEEIFKMDGMDIDAGIVGFTALHAAVVQGQVAAVEWLLSHGASVNCRKEEKWQDSVLHYAAANGHAEVTRLLLRFGANPCMKNFEDATPGDLALSCGHADLASALFKASNVYSSGFENHSPASAGGLPSVIPLAPGGSASFPDAPTISLSLPPLEPSESPEPVVRRGGMGRKSSSRSSMLDLPGAGAGAKEDSSAGVAPIGRLNPSLLLKAGEKGEEVQRYLARPNYGLGTYGATLKKGTHTWRVLAVISQLAGCLYFLWRANRSINREHLLFSLAFYLCELATFAPSFLFCMEVWAPVEREPRSLQAMCLTPAEFPAVDVYVVCYNEPVAIIEATVCAALNMTYPPAKLQVQVLDDGKRKAVEDMCSKLQKEMMHKASGPYGRGWASLGYAARKKVKGVPHHAKAGNINSQLLKGRRRGWRQGAFVVVFDCDMIPRPDFLDRVMGHFFEPILPPQAEPAEAAKQPQGASDASASSPLLASGGGSEGLDADPAEEMAPLAWVPRTKLAFVQTPQDFYNVDKDDPMGHRAAFFYGPMMQGRDGIGACPCVGTGVVFRRDALISIGGQAFGSITEDYNSAMTLMGAGFSSIYLNERLIYGLAPDDLESVFKQRLRWAMGSLQILCRSNPLFKPELTVPQSLLFFQSAFQYCLSLPTVVVTLAPVLYLFLQVGPISARVYEFCLFFAVYYGCNRVMLWAAHKGVPNKGLEMWRGSQAWVWTVPNNLKACWKVFTSELWIFKILGVSEIGFAVTNKDAQSDWRQALGATWVYFLYYALIAAGGLLNVARYCMGHLTNEAAIAHGVALAWGLLICMYLWPPVALVLPCQKAALGGKVEWDETPAELADAFHRNLGPAAEVEKQIQQEAEVMSKEAGGSWWRKAKRFVRATIANCFGRGTQPMRISSSMRSLSGSATLLSRPEFTLMRRMRDSVMFVLVNSVTIASIAIAGLLYLLYQREPLEEFLHTHVIPSLARAFTEAQSSLSFLSSRQ
eukprot:TRINITY_DN22077_c0_g1_i1.p1 TRINITY_DN22077_c0_g1~~TRINITY_DN22077_c0_g1_i1.p1  ORF type:complete len:1726 (+),score=392.82 TRINITY_DN22077_c0_g1_i1:475-5652(+)